MVVPSLLRYQSTRVLTTIMLSTTYLVPAHTRDLSPPGTGVERLACRSFCCAPMMALYRPRTRSEGSTEGYVQGNYKVNRILLRRIDMHLKA